MRSFVNPVSGINGIYSTLRDIKQVSDTVAILFSAYLVRYGECQHLSYR